MLHLEADVIFQSINQSVHLACTTRQSRKGDITSWKAYAPGQAGKTAIEAVGRSCLGERAPAPIYEGRDAVIAWMLAGADAEYSVSLPDKSAPMRLILDSYTKEHSAEYQAQALVDIGFALHARNLQLEEVAEVVIQTSHHTHQVIGSGADDPQKIDPDASRETLDHSAMYILAVAWEDGCWHHVHSYSPERAHRESTVCLWHKIRTEELEEWTSAYHEVDPNRRKFGAEVVVRMRDGSVISERLDNPNAHSHGAHPFQRSDYIRKLRTLAEDIADGPDLDRFVDLVERLTELGSDEVRHLNVTIPEDRLLDASSDRNGIL